MKVKKVKAKGAIHGWKKEEEEEFEKPRNKNRLGEKELYIYLKAYSPGDKRLLELRKKFE